MTMLKLVKDSVSSIEQFMTRYRVGKRLSILYDLPAHPIFLDGYTSRVTSH